MLTNIPLELRQLQQWVCAGTDKFPINPRTKQLASSTDPSTWASFEEACQSSFRHIGFVLSKDDPYSIIDLDQPLNDQQAARHSQIFQSFDSYSELSQSGQGVHIVLRGKVPSGVRRDKVELYSDSRYMICTGNVIRSSPIADYQEALLKLHGEMATTVSTELVEIAPIITDEQLLDMAREAENKEKFQKLWNGNTQGYPSQSEADFALLSMLAFYSKSDSQVRRLFRLSGLGNRSKALKNDNYIDRALSKIRGKQNELPLVDFSQLRINGSAEPIHLTSDIEYPPGLVGEMARYVYSSAIRPVHEVAIAAAIALLAGIVGRCYNISSTGLNQYIILLAKTGTGKEGAAGGMDAMLARVREIIPAADEFIGPGSFASGQALVRVLDSNPCFVSVLGEIGITLQQICCTDAPSHLVQLRRVLLDVFAKSGAHNWLKPSVYADHEKNTTRVRAPNITILGEGTPESFYNGLDVAHISEGLIPRFLVIEYKGLRPPPNPHAFHKPDADLVARLIAACQIAITMRGNDSVCNVNTNVEARALLDDFSAGADVKINKANDEITAQLWNRAHIKALKLAALVAVGCDLHNPIITYEIATWAVELVKRDIETMCGKFNKGEVGKGDHAQEGEIMRAVERYRMLTKEQRKVYNVPDALLDKSVVPYVFLKRWCCQRVCFKSDKRGAVMALKIALDDILRAGTMVQVSTSQAKEELGVTQPLYYLP